MKWTDWMALFGLTISLGLAHHYQPISTDVFLVVCLVIFLSQVIGCKFMSPAHRGVARSTC
jgi:hypothetical protein